MTQPAPHSSQSHESGATKKSRKVVTAIVAQYQIYYRHKSAQNDIYPRKMTKLRQLHAYICQNCRTALD